MGARNSQASAETAAVLLAVHQIASRMQRGQPVYGSLRIIKPLVWGRLYL